LSGGRLREARGGRVLSLPSLAERTKATILSRRQRMLLAFVALAPLANDGRERFQKGRLSKGPPLTAFYHLPAQLELRKTIKTMVGRLSPARPCWRWVAWLGDCRQRKPQESTVAVCWPVPACSICRTVFGQAARRIRERRGSPVRSGRPQGWLGCSTQGRASLARGRGKKSRLFSDPLRQSAPRQRKQRTGFRPGSYDRYPGGCWWWAPSPHNSEIKSKSRTSGRQEGPASVPPGSSTDFS